ncbi:DUF167 domain-containing protein [Candidatus Woesearchaeota archaeon]|nr:DUF167 domain-containing protein [Candidatus Woesearchaeota archaeon]
MNITVKVKTNARKSEIVKIEDAAYHVHLKARPEKGEANLELVKLLGRHFKKPVRIIRGFTSKQKVVSVDS